MINLQCLLTKQGHKQTELSYDQHSAYSRASFKQQTTFLSAVI